MVLVAASGNTSWGCYPSLVSYALEQPERLRSPDYRHKCHAPFKFAPTVYCLYIGCFHQIGRNPPVSIIYPYKLLGLTLYLHFLLSKYESAIDNGVK